MVRIFFEEVDAFSRSTVPAFALMDAVAFPGFAFTAAWEKIVPAIHRHRNIMPITIIRIPPLRSAIRRTACLLP